MRQDFQKAIEAAIVSKKVLDKHKLKAFPKTSGKIGIHITFPALVFHFRMPERYASIYVTKFMQQFATLQPQQYVLQSGERNYILTRTKMTKRVHWRRLIRQDHITFRWFQVRLEWKEINSKLDPKSFTIRTIGKRLEKGGDLFADDLLEKNVKYNSKFSDHCFKTVNHAHTFLLKHDLERCFQTKA